MMGIGRIITRWVYKAVHKYPTAFLGLLLEVAKNVMKDLKVADRPLNVFESNRRTLGGTGIGIG